MTHLAGGGGDSLGGPEGRHGPRGVDAAAFAAEDEEDEEADA